MNEKIKVVAMSDIHGYLPPKDSLPKCDVVCIAGDILPLEIQKNSVKSLSWILLDFKPWADSLDCDKVLFIAGNRRQTYLRSTYTHWIYRYSNS